VVMVRRGGFAPPPPLAAGLRPAGLACARAGARSTTRVWLAIAYSVFKVRSRGSPGKKKRGLASPGPLLTPLLVVRVPIAPTEESPGPVTLDWVPAKGRCVSLPAIAAKAGIHSRHGGCRFPSRRFAYGSHGMEEHIARHDDLSSCQIDWSWY